MITCVPAPKVTVKILSESISISSPSIVINLPAALVEPPNTRISVHSSLIVNEILVEVSIFKHCESVNPL